MSSEDEAVTEDESTADTAPSGGRRWTGRSIAAIVLAVLLVAGFVVGLVASKHQKDNEKSSGASPAATVDGVKLSRTQLLAEVDTWVANKAYVLAAAQQQQVMADKAGHPTPSFQADILTQQIGDVLITREFNRRHLKVTAADEAQLRQQVSGNTALQAYPKLFLDSIIARATRTSVLERKLVPTQALYQRAYHDQYACPSGRDVFHILVATLAQANAIETQLHQGVPFATLAASKSTDTGSAQSGGSVGCLKRGAFVAPFENAAFAAKIGVPTAPVKSQYGYHVILVKAHSAKSDPPLASVKSQLVQSGAVFNAFLETTLAKATVTVDPSFGAWKATATGFAVVPPVAARTAAATATTASAAPLPVADGRPRKP